MGQAADSPIVFSSQDAIVTSFVTPISSVGGVGGSTPGQWLKVEFHYAVTVPEGNYLDAAQFKIWIEGRDLLAKNAPTKAGIAIGLTGAETYVNIPAGKDVYGVFYVHPDTLGRYSTPTGPTDFDRTFDIHLEAYVGGKKMDNIDKRKETDPTWYQKLQAVPDLVYRQDQSPFLLTDLGRYPATRLTGGDDGDAGGGGDVPSGPAPASTPAPDSAATPSGPDNSMATPTTDTSAAPAAPAAPTAQ